MGFLYINCLAHFLDVKFVRYFKLLWKGQTKASRTSESDFRLLFDTFSSSICLQMSDKLCFKPKLSFENPRKSLARVYGDWSFTWWWARMEHGNMKLQIKTDFLIVPDTDFKLHQKSLYSAKWRRTDAELWDNYPYQPLDNDIQNYYMIELALYLSLMCTLFIGKALFKQTQQKKKFSVQRFFW